MKFKKIFFTFLSSTYSDQKVPIRALWSEFELIENITMDSLQMAIGLIGLSDTRSFLYYIRSDLGDHLSRQLRFIGAVLADISAFDWKNGYGYTH